MKKILVVDDEEEIRLAVGEALKRKGYAVKTAAEGEEALALMKGARFDMIVSDLNMPGRSGIELLKVIKMADPRLPVLLITAFGTIEKAVEAVKEGAVDFLLKPFTLEALEATVERALKEEEDISSFEVRGKALLAGDPAMRSVMSMALTAAYSEATVLISGESGTGKELLARFIHMKGARKQNPFVAVNCASIPEGLLESELFGHEKGAFTGALKERQGKFEQASGGTLLLDEISEMDVRLQAKILRVIQEKEVERLGGRSPVPLDLRIIATTNRNLKAEVREGRFREDLFYRLNIFPICIPPLRERRSDIEPLAINFMKRFGAKYCKRLEGISEGALTHLLESPWRGNVRELENTIERAVLVSAGATLELEHLLVNSDGADARSLGKGAHLLTGKEAFTAAVAAGGGGVQTPFVSFARNHAPESSSGWTASNPLFQSQASSAVLDRQFCANPPFQHPVQPAGLGGGGGEGVGVNENANNMTLFEMERGLIYKTLSDCAGNRTKTARILGISVRTLRNKLKEYGQLLPG